MNTTNSNIFEAEVFEKLNEIKDLYDPLIVSNVSRSNNISNVSRFDGTLDLEYLGKKIRVCFEIKNRTAPKIVEAGILQLKNDKSIEPNLKYLPALIVPYLSESVIRLLKDYSISGLDLNGNYYIASKDFVAIRLDQENKYRESTSIKNIYRGTSSLVGRYLLQQKKIYSSVSEIFNGIIDNKGAITFPTVSKVLTALEDDLIVSKESGKIRVLQPEALLQKLSENYQPPTPVKTWTLKLSPSRLEAKEILDKYLTDQWIWAGESSVDRYAVTTPTRNFMVYAAEVYDPEGLKNISDPKFYNYSIQILSSEQKYVFFAPEMNYASKIQVYLELMQLDKREREIADDIKKEIINEFRS